MRRGASILLLVVAGLSLDGGRQALSLGETRGAIGLLREYVRRSRPTSPPT